MGSEMCIRDSDAGAAKGQSQPILVHAKADSKSKSNKPSAA